MEDLQECPKSCARILCEVVNNDNSQMQLTCPLYVLSRKSFMKTHIYLTHMEKHLYNALGTFRTQGAARMKSYIAASVSNWSIGSPSRIDRVGGLRCRATKLTGKLPPTSAMHQSFAILFSCSCDALKISRQVHARLGEKQTTSLYNVSSKRTRWYITTTDTVRKYASHTSLLRPSSPRPACRNKN